MATHVGPQGSQFCEPGRGPHAGISDTLVGGAAEEHRTSDTTRFCLFLLKHQQFQIFWLDMSPDPLKSCSSNHSPGPATWQGLPFANIHVHAFIFNLCFCFVLGPVVGFCMLTNSLMEEICPYLTHWCISFYPFYLCLLCNVFFFLLLVWST